MLQRLKDGLPQPPSPSAGNSAVAADATSADAAAASAGVASLGIDFDTRPSDIW